MEFGDAHTEPLAGHILAAALELLDPNFHRTLVYVAQHDFEGALGLVLNRPTGHTLGDVVNKPEMQGPLARVPVFRGGPVKPNQVLIALFTQTEAGSEVTCSINVPLDEAEHAFTSGKGWVRAFMGYAGWSQGQLEGELAESAWKVLPVEPVVFNEQFAGGLWSLYMSGDKRWRHLVRYLPDHAEWN